MVDMNIDVCYEKMNIKEFEALEMNESSMQSFMADEQIMNKMSSDNSR